MNIRPTMLRTAKLGTVCHQRCDRSGTLLVGSVCNFQPMSGAGPEAIVSWGVSCRSDWLLENPD